MTDPVVNGPDTTTGSADTAPVAERTTPRTREREAPETAPAPALTPPAAPSAPDVVGAPGDRGDRGGEGGSSADDSGGEGGAENRSRRRRGSRGGRNRNRGGPVDGADPEDAPLDRVAEATDAPVPGAARRRGGGGAKSGRGPSEAAADGSVAPPDELPDRPGQGKIRSAETAARALVRKPQIGDTRPAPAPAEGDDSGAAADADEGGEGEARNR